MKLADFQNKETAAPEEADQMHDGSMGETGVDESEDKV